jgi:hypothetical protein
MQEFSSILRETSEAHLRNSRVPGTQFENQCDKTKQLNVTFGFLEQLFFRKEKGSDDSRYVLKQRTF